MAVVVALAALTSLAAHWGKAVFHDGVRPIVPEVAAGRMERKQLAGIAFGLSTGFIFAVGLSFAVSFQILNPWLLLLPTDILGILAANWVLAIGLGALWALVVMFGLSGLAALLSSLPIGMVEPLGTIAGPFLLAVSLFPLLAILTQFGRLRAICSALIVIGVRQGSPLLGLEGEELQTAVATAAATLLLVGFAIRRGMAERNREAVVSRYPEESEEQLQSRRKLRRGLPLLMAIGALAAAACQLGVFSGSDAALPFLHNAREAGEIQREGWLFGAATVELTRLLGFMPLLAATALATGVYGLFGLMLVFPIGYLSPDPAVAAVLGALTIWAEFAAIGKLAEKLQRHPIVRATADSLRSAMNAAMEFGLAVGGALAVIAMEGGRPGIGLLLYIGLYAGNEAMGRPVMRLAIGPAAAIACGLLLNALHFAGLFALPA